MKKLKIDFKIPIPFTKKIPEGGRHFHVLAWRKVFWVSLDRRSFWVGFHGEHLSDHDDEWHIGVGYHNLSINFDRWEWGRSHMYYDGPHDSFSLGYVHFNWQGDWCEKCYSGE